MNKAEIALIIVSSILGVTISLIIYCAIIIRRAGKYHFGDEISDRSVRQSLLSNQEEQQ